MSPQHGAGSSVAGSSARGGSLLLGLAATCLLALSLRIPTTSLGPVLPRIGEVTGHGETFLSLLTAIPLALTLVAAPVSPRVARRLGRDRAVGLALAAVAVGVLVRSLPGDVPLVAGTVLLGLGIAVATVLGPATISSARRADRPVLTATYSMSLSVGPALALALTVPLMHVAGLDWAGTLALWSLCVIAAWTLWIARTRDLHAARVPEPINGAHDTDASGPTPAVISDPGVWQLALYMGLTSLTFYTTSTWLPTVLVLGGTGTAPAGAAASLVSIAAIPFSFAAPILLRRAGSRLLVLLAPLVALAGIVLLVVTGSSAPIAIAVLLGISQGLCLGISYDRVVQYARSPDHAAAVSALTFTVGIALAALGPLLFGAALEATRSTLVPLCGLGATVLLQGIIGLCSRALRPS